MKKIRLWLIVAALGLLSLLPFLLDQYSLHIMIFIIMYMVLALSWDIIARTGQLSLAHYGFFGLGAYASALSSVKMGFHPLLSFLFAVLIVCAVAFVLGYLTLKLKGLYFAIATLAFSEVMRTAAVQFKGLTGGAIGITMPPLFGGQRIYSFYLLVFILILLAAFSFYLERSHHHLALNALRTNSDVAEGSGIDVFRYKLICFVGTAIFPALMGGFYAQYITYIIPYEVFNLNISVSGVVMAVFGGFYTTAGPILGALILKLVEEYLKSTIVYGYFIVYGLILIVVILFMPKGIVGVIKNADLGSKKPFQTLRRFIGSR